MFRNQLWQQLHTRIVRYIAPYDAAVHIADSQQSDRVRSREPKRPHLQVLVAFYHSELHADEAAERRARTSTTCRSS